MIGDENPVGVVLRRVEVMELRALRSAKHLGVLSLSSVGCRSDRRRKGKNNCLVQGYEVDSLSAIRIETKNSEVKPRSFVLQADFASVEERQSQRGFQTERR